MSLFSSRFVLISIHLKKRKTCQKDLDQMINGWHGLLTDY